MSQIHEHLVAGVYMDILSRYTLHIVYLCKVAMDIVAKLNPPDKSGVRIAKLDEMSYREKLWSHTPLTGFWQVGEWYSKRLESLELPP